MFRICRFSLTTALVAVFYSQGVQAFFSVEEGAFVRDSQHDYLIKIKPHHGSTIDHMQPLGYEAFGEKGFKAWLRSEAISHPFFGLKIFGRKEQLQDKVCTNSLESSKNIFSFSDPLPISRIPWCLDGVAPASPIEAESKMAAAQDRAP